MNNAVLQKKPYFSLKNVLSILEIEIDDIKYFINKGELSVYAKVVNKELMGYAFDQEKKCFIGKARVSYSGGIKLKAKSVIDILDKKTSATYGFSLASEKSIKKISEEIPDYVYDSFIDEWVQLEAKDDIMKLSYSLFPFYVEHKFVKNINQLIESQHKEGNMFWSKLNLPEKSLGWGLEVNSSEIMFSKEEVNELLNSSSEKETVVQPMELSWSEGYRFNPINYVAERLVLNSDQKNDTLRWRELMRDVEDEIFKYDVDQCIENIDMHCLVYQNMNKKSTTIKTQSFFTKLSKVRSFYKNKAQ